MSKICYHDPDKLHTRDDQSWKGLDPQTFWNDYLALIACILSLGGAKSRAGGGVGGANEEACGASCVLSLPPGDP